MDRIFHRFLENTFSEAIEITKKSDVLRITPLPPYPPSRYLCEFSTPYLRRSKSGVIEVAPGPVLAGLHFPGNYLRSGDPELYLKVASLLTGDLAHPNVSGFTVCLGSAFAPGTPITCLLWELYDIFSYRNLDPNERNALNPEACRLVREHHGLLDEIKPKPFLRPKDKIKIQVKEI